MSALTVLCIVTNGRSAGLIPSCRLDRGTRPERRSAKLAGRGSARCRATRARAPPRARPSSSPSCASSSCPFCPSACLPVFLVLTISVYLPISVPIWRVWLYMAKSGRMAKCARILAHLTAYGCIWAHLDASGRMWQLHFDFFGAYFRFFSRCTSGSDFDTKLGVVLVRCLLHFGVAERVFRL